MKQREGEDGTQSAANTNICNTMAPRTLQKPVRKDSADNHLVKTTPSDDSMQPMAEKTNNTIRRPRAAQARPYTPASHSVVSVGCKQRLFAGSCDGQVK